MTKEFSPWPTDPKIQATFYGRHVTKHDLLSKFSKPPVMLKQIHSTRVVTISDQNKYDFHEGDASVTKLCDIALTVHTADCLPILAYGGDVIGACHGGWRGVADGIIETFIAAFGMHGVDKGQIKLSVGPAIGPCHFEVGNDVADKLCPSSIPKNLQEVIRRPHLDPQKAYINLKQLTRYKLLKLGLKEQNLSFSSDCTFCGPEFYHSYRRDGAVNGHPRGLLEAVIIKPCD